MNQFLRDVDVVIRFAIAHPDGCIYKIVCNCNDLQNNKNWINFWKSQWGQHVGFMTNDEYIRHNGCSIEEMGEGAYYHIDNTIYIAVPYTSDEFTLLRTLTHEYGHYIQDKSGYNRATCDSRLLEYHNIWFNENPYNRDTLSNFNRINEVSGFRLSSIYNYCKLNTTNIIADLFNLDLEVFLQEHQSKFQSGITIYNEKLLKDIYDSVQRMRQENSLWLPLYYNLFYCFIKGL